MVRHSNTVRLLLFAVIATGVVIAQTPQIWMSGRLLSGNQVMRAMAMEDLRPYQLDRVVHDTGSADFLQVRTRVQHQQEVGDIKLVLENVAKDTRVFLNNIRIRDSQAETGRHALVFTLPPAFWHSGENALDVITPATDGRVGPALAFLAGSGTDISNIRRYLQVSSFIRFLVTIAGLCASAWYFTSLAFDPREGGARWPLATIVLSLAISVMALARLGSMSVPTATVSAIGLSSALLCIGMSLYLVRRRNALSQEGRLDYRSPFISLAIALCLLAGQAAALSGPLFDVWPVALVAIGMGLALAYFGWITLSLTVAGGRTIFDAVKRTLHRDALIREQKRTISRQSDDLEAEIHRRAVLEERGRFSRDIHDGLGGSLLSLLVQVRTGKVKPGEIEQALEANLDELRMMVDSLDHGERSLDAALLTFQSRVRQLFSHAGIELEWIQTEVTLPDRASPDFILHLYRILQEAGSNIVRHSNATKAQYRFEWDEVGGELLVSISDNGANAISSPEDRDGKGLKNMAQRVTEMSGEFQAGPSVQSGWSVRFSLPV